MPFSTGSSQLRYQSHQHCRSLPSKPPGKPKKTGVGSLSLLQGNLPYPGIEPGSPALQAGSLPSELPVLFIYFWPCWVVIAGQAFSSCGVQASHCGGFCCRAWALGDKGSVVIVHGLPCSIWSLPGPGIEPMSSALAGGFLTTGLPGKSCSVSVFDLPSQSRYSSMTIEYS